MTKSKSWLQITLTGVLSLYLLLTPVVAHAATATNHSGNGIRVTPLRSDKTIDPGKSLTLLITVTNVTAVPESLQAVVNDFMASSDESGSPALILNSNQFAQSHSLKRFVKPIPDFTLQPGESKAVPVVITVPANALAGGYYGAVRFAPASSGPKNQTVTLAGSVGSLVLLTVPGDIKDQLSLASFDVRHGDTPSNLFLTNKNLTAVVRFQNEGNIQEEPFGKILLKNHSGKVLGQFEINSTDPKGNVLPDSIRRFTVKLNHVGSFGEYKLEGNFGYGSNGQLLSASTTFYILPAAVVIAFLCLVALVLFLIFGLPRLIRAYNERVIRRAGRR